MQMTTSTICNRHGHHVPYSSLSTEIEGKNLQVVSKSIPRYTNQVSPTILITGCQRFLYNVSRYVLAVGKM